MCSIHSLLLLWLMVCLMVITPHRVVCQFQNHMMTADASSFDCNGGSFGPAGYTFAATQFCNYALSPPQIPGLPLTIFFTLESTTVPTSQGQYLFMAISGTQPLDQQDVTITVGMRTPSGQIFVSVHVGDVPFKAISDWTIPSGPTDNNPITVTIQLTATGASINNDRGNTWSTATITPPLFHSFLASTLGIGDLISSGISTTIRDINIVSNSASGSGDPQFYGFHGQSFQVHGFPDAIMNLITMNDFQWNSLFVYLDGTNRVMTRERYNHTQPYTHPGTYLGELYFNTPTGNIHIRAGSYEQGLTIFNNSHIIAYHGHVTTHDRSDMTISMISTHRVVINTRYLSITVDNSDWFVNIGVHQLNLKPSHPCETLMTRKISHLSSNDPYHTQCTLHNVHTGEIVPMHGLIGGTYRNLRFAHNGLYEGEPDDYRVSTPSGTDFTFNLYRD